MNRIATKSVACVVLGMIGLLTVGCSQARHSDLVAEGPVGLFRPATEKDVAAIEYRVAPPDKLAIQAPGIKELDKLTTQIRPDGKISVNLLGDIFVAGKTPEEINKLLLDAANKYYNNADIKVEIVEYASKHYQIVGTSIRDQGKKPF